MHKKNGVWIKKVAGQGAKHSAFTDLIDHRNLLYCCYREAGTHISADGCIKVITLDTDGNISQHHRLSLHQTDIRDPKLSITPDNKLLLTAYARKTDGSGNTLYGQPVCWFSDNGKSWSSPIFFGERNWWLWRVSWHNGIAYGFAYNRGQQKLKFYKGDPRRTFSCINEEVLSLEKHDLAYPNESDMLFQDNKAYALVRRDAGSCSAQLGVSSYPYIHWKWHDLKHYIGGPAILCVEEEKIIAAGRFWAGSTPVTALYQLDLKNKSLTPNLILPSAGDSSYPGLVKKDDHLYISYYSSHVDNKSQIFLAKFKL